MSEEEKPVRIPFRAKDESSAVIKRIEERVEHLGHTVDRAVGKVSELGASMAGIYGAFGLEKMIDSGRESLEQISKLGKLTGVANDKVAAMRDVFEQSGLGAEQMSRTMTALSKKALMLDENGKAITMEAKRWGVELNKGPVNAMLSLSNAVRRHKIDQAGVMKLTGATRENLGGMMELLEKGPEELHDTIDAARKLNKHLADPEAIERFHEFHKSTQQIHEAWRRMTERVVIGLAPALTKLAEKLSVWMEKVGDHASDFATKLVKGLELAVGHAKTLGKIMLANSILEKTTGHGLLANAARVPGIAGKIFGFGASRAAGVAGFAGGIMRGAGGLAGIGGAVGPMTTVITMVAKLVGGLSGIGLVAGAIYLVVKNLDTLKEKLGNVASAIWKAVKNLGDTLSATFAADAPLGKFARWVGDKFIKALEYAGELIEKIINVVSAGIDEINDELVSLTGFGKYSTQRRNEESDENYRRSVAEKAEAKTKANEAFEKLGGNEAFRKIELMVIKGMKVQATEQQYELYQAWKKMMEVNLGKDYPQMALGSRFAAMEKTFGTKPLGGDMAPSAGIYQDFRNSRFDITQKFAEGFDPDRIAVAFANDIASAGERRLVSGLTPAFSIR